MDTQNWKQLLKKKLTKNNNLKIEKHPFETITVWCLLQLLHVCDMQAREPR